MKQRTSERTLPWAAGILMLAVAFGAFGAHSIRTHVDAEAYHIWTTAAQYQFFHGLALLGLAALEGRLASRVVGFARILFLLGILCFCGSLYLLAARDLLGLQGIVKILGPITPLGGLLFIAGWGTILAGSIRRD